MGRDDDADCVQGLSAEEGGSANVLIVSYNRAPGVIIDHWRSRIGDEPTEFGIVTIGGGNARTGTHRLQPSDDRNTISLASPASLGRLETTIRLYLDQWSANDDPTILCFDSVSSLLHYVDRTTAFRFLYSLMEYLRVLDVDAHFHIDPDAHDDATIAMLCSLFDVVSGRVETGPPISAEVLSALLGEPRRQLACRHLGRIDGGTTVSETARQIATWEGSGTASANEQERVHISLRHVHLPKLADVDVLEQNGEVVTPTVSSDVLRWYVRLTGDGTSTDMTPAVPDKAHVQTNGPSVDEADEAYWTVYGTASDSIVVTLARALGDVLDVHPTELRPVLADVIDIDALQRLAEHGEISVYATFEYGGYEVVVDSGQIKLYESR